MGLVHSAELPRSTVMSTTLPTHHVLADDGTLAFISESSSSSSTDSTDSAASIMALIRTRFHEEMEVLMDQYKVNLLGEGKERVDGQLVYRIDCPLHTPEEDDSPIMRLDLWCFEETKESFSLGFRVNCEKSVEFAKIYFKSALEKPWKRSIESLLTDFYVFAEHSWHPNQRLFIRDFAYPVSSPLHFGHRTKAIRASIPPLENYEARVVYPYDAAIDGELSVDTDEVLLVLKNLGNGWVCARRRSQTGLVPENYIQRLFQR